MPRLVKVDLGVKPVQDQHGYRVCAGSTDCNTNNLYLLCMQDQQEDQRPFKDWRLAKDSELRLEVAPEDTIEIQLLLGVGEIFGTELAKNKPYTIYSRAKIAVFTWYGCTVRVTGTPEHCYLSHETPMVMYLNAHVAIDQLRHRNECEGKMGAKVLVVGPTDVGKSTICKILLSYALRMGRQPCFVDLDVGQASISMPGTMGILPIERPADISEGTFSKKASLVYHFGYSSPGPNLKLYNTVVSSIVEIFNAKCEANPKSKTGGCIINTCGWVDGGGYKVLLHAARTFQVDVVLVMDHERLYNDLQQNLPSSTHIIPLPKSGGVVVRSRDFRRRNREEAVREYFYGRKPHTLFPFSFEVPFAEVQIYKIGAPDVPESALPIGMEIEEGSTHLIPVEPSKELVHSILSLSMASSLDEGLVKTCVAGFLCINGVDPEKEVMTVLSPAPRPLPRKFLLLTDLKFMDWT